MERVVYRATNPPSKGGKYFILQNKIEAIKKAKDLNKKAIKKDWVWG